MTYRAHCAGVRLRRNLRKRRRAWRLNRDVYSWASIEIRVNGHKFTEVESIDWERET